MYKILKINFLNLNKKIIHIFLHKKSCHKKRKINIDFYFLNCHFAD